MGSTEGWKYPYWRRTKERFRCRVAWFLLFCFCSPQICPICLSFSPSVSSFIIFLVILPFVYFLIFYYVSSFDSSSSPALLTTVFQKKRYCEDGIILNVRWYVAAVLGSLLEETRSRNLCFRSSRNFLAAAFMFLLLGLEISLSLRVHSPGERGMLNGCGSKPHWYLFGDGKATLRLSSLKA